MRLHHGQKVGLIGANGTGKSTLFQILKGTLSADGGEVSLPAGWRVAHMSQEITRSDQTAIDFVLDGDQEYRRLQSAIENHQGSGTELASLHSAFEDVDGYTAEARASALLSGLGFEHKDFRNSVEDFSGGWRIRLNLAQALMCPADLMLLDEPTNHLDLNATWWLEQQLLQFKGTLLVISHDRDFLDNVIDNIVQIYNEALHTFSGNYSSFERQRQERLAQQQQLFEQQQLKIAEIERFIERFKAKATKAKQAQSRIKALERLERIAPAHVDSPFSFKLPCYEKTSQPLIQIRQGQLGYPQKQVLDNVELRIEADSRIGLLGPNGAGKSTLVKSLVGDQPLLDGQRQCGEHLRIGYFNQHQLEALDIQASPALHLQRLEPKASDQSIRDFLGGFDFRGDRAFETIEHFSGGEKARLALAIIAWQKPNLLLLDEPTNHLDLEMRESLTLALQGYEGAVVVISHDRHLLRNTVEDFLLVSSGCVQPFDGDLDDYHQWLDSHLSNSSEQTANTDKPQEVQDKKEKRQQAAAIRQQLAPLRKELKQCEKKMDRFQGILDDLESQMSDTSLYQEDRKEELQKLLKEQGDARAQLEELELTWMELSEDLETQEQTLSR